MNISIIVTGHGEFAEGFKSALTLLIGEPANTYFINFDEAFEVYQTKLIHLVKELSVTSEKVIVFTDLAGGSPFNVSCLASKDCTNVDVISGSNLPMIIDTITNVMYDLGDVTADNILNTGHESLVCFMKTTSKQTVIDEDGI